MDVVLTVVALIIAAVGLLAWTFRGRPAQSDKPTPERAPTRYGYNTTIAQQRVRAAAVNGEDSNDYLHRQAVIANGGIDLGPLTFYILAEQLLGTSRYQQTYPHAEYHSPIVCQPAPANHFPQPVSDPTCAPTYAPDPSPTYTPDPTPAPSYTPDPAPSYTPDPAPSYSAPSYSDPSPAPSFTDPGSF